MKNAVSYVTLLLLLAGLVGLVWYGMNNSATGAGGPYTADINAGVSGNLAIFELKVTDANGKPCRSIKLPDGKTSPPPKLMIVDETGKVVHTAQFAFG